MAIKPFNSVGGFSVGESPANVILANGDITTSNANLSANLYVTNTANVGNLRTDNILYANGTPWDFQEAAGNTWQIQYNVANNFAASANFTYDDSIQNLVILGNANVTKTFFGNIGSFTGNISALNANLGNLATANYVNIANEINGNIANFSGNLTSLNANLGNLATANYVNVANEINGNVANFSGNLTSLNANLGNLATANYVNVANEINGNIANFSGNLTSLNANLGNLATANYVNVANEINGNIANFSGNLTALNANLGNLATANFINLSSNLSVTDTANVGNLRTDNLLYANGQPWDLQEAAGSNTQVQYNDGNNDFAASANFTYDDVASNLTVLGNIIATSFIGNISGNISAPGSNTQILFNDANITNAVANFSYDKAFNSGAGKLNVGNTVGGQIITDNVYASYGNIGNLDVTTDIEVGGNITGVNNISANSANYTANLIANNLTVNLELSGNTANFTGNVVALNTNAGNLLTANFANIASNLTASNVTVNLELSGNTANFTGNINSALNANLGNLLTANFANIASNVTTSNLTVNLELSGNTANFSGNITSLNANLGNLATANFVNVASNITTSNLTVNTSLSGNTANFSGNVIVPNLTVNLELSGNTANFTGNVIAANIIGALANGTSNVKVYNNANIEFTINNVANVATISSTGLYVAGEINTTTGNMLSNGNITANLFLNSANANVTGEALLGSVKTSNITAPTGTITISAAGANNNIILSPSGVGNVDVGLHNITQVALPINPNDAATKEYVDNISQGLYIHPAANVTSTSNLNASYLNGGTVLSVTTITGNDTITFSTNHGLPVDADIQFTNSFNGIIGGEGYFVFSVPAANQITIKNGYFGAEITTLVNGAGLTEPALGEPGVGATLTNAGAQVALTIDGILMTVGARVLVQGQTDQTENGIYSVTTVGTGATNWVLTRASDGNSYAPKSDTQLGAGSYFFVMQGSQFAGASYVLTLPPGEIYFGTSNIVFSQFSQAGSYTAGNGIAITGTLISANIDGVTTDIVGGNITVKTSANLTTPNIGDATFSSITWNTLSNGNVTANNLSISNIANITGNLRVDGIIESNGNVTSNAFINGNNASFTNFANIGGNLLANNITSNNDFSTNTANISSNLVTSNATVNLELSGNTANFSGNVILPNLTVNLELSGNTANFTGNVVALNTNAGNLLTANFANIASNITTSNLAVNLALTGNTANFSGNITSLNANLGNLATANYFTGTFINGTSNVAIPTSNGNINLTAGGNTSLVVTNTGANITGNLGVSGNFSVGSLVSNNLTANLNVFVGNTTISWGTVTTNTITSNQTIASLNVTSVTGLEFLVKGIDTTGAKYSVATVQAVTDGANVDYATFATVNLGGATGSFVVNVVSGNIQLQVTPASSNSTLWTTQVRFI